MAAMLLFVVLCLAAKFALGLEDPPLPKWPPVYSVKMDYYEPAEEYHLPVTLWNDEVQKKQLKNYPSLMLQKYDEANMTALENSTHIKVYPITTEEHLNMLHCCALTDKYIEDDTWMPNLEKGQYVYVGTERIHGEDGLKYQIIINWNNLTIERVMWVVLKKDVYTPLKYEVKIHNPAHGTLMKHYYVDYYEFDTSAIDNKTWDIAKDLDCEIIYDLSSCGGFMPDFFMEDHKELDPIHNEFAQFKVQFNKEYQSEDEHNKRLKIFKDNVRFINEHNKAGHSFKLKVNHLADRTKQELAMMRGRLPRSGPSKALPFPHTAEEVERLSQDLPTEFDWRPYGAVTFVKNQGYCGSCWAFSAVGAVEGAFFLRNGRDQLVRLSEQAVIDCSWGFDNGGCGGGLPEHAFDWMKVHGVPLDDAYGGYLHYTSMCHIDNVTSVATVKNYYDVTTGSEKALQVAIFKYGPVSVSIDAGSLEFNFYSHGVFYDPALDLSNLTLPNPSSSAYITLTLNTAQAHICRYITGAGACASQVPAMLLYAVLCLAAALAPSLEVEPPTFSPVYSLRSESFKDNGRRVYSKIWVDTNKGICREDLLDGTEQFVYKHSDEQYENYTTVHRVFPVTTEESANVRKCFVIGNLYVIFFDYPLYTLPDLKKGEYYFDGTERVRDEDATKWTAVFRFLSPNNYTFTSSIWIANRDGVSIPLREQLTKTDDYYRTSDTGYVDFYDYNPYDIDPEVWNIGAGMECGFAATSDAEYSDLIEDMTPTKLMGEFENFHNLEGNLRYLLASNIGRRGHELVMKTMYERKKESIDHSDQRNASESSKALPFPYSAEEVERLSQALPEQFDWRLYGAVGSPRTPGYVSYPYEFATAALVESALFIRNGMEVMVRLSPQAILDCSWGFGNRGNNGGSVEASLEWVMKHGLPADDVYPYKGTNDYCRIDEVDKMTKVKAYYQVPPNDEMALKLAIVNHGPVAVVYDERCDSLVFYTHGIYSDKKCRNNAGSQSAPALIVGYGILDGEKYWIFQRLIGPSWGIDGYGLMAIDNNICGVMNSPIFVTVE